MTLFKNVNGVDVEMTPEEEAEIRALWAASEQPIVPQSVTPRQARLALNAAGLLDQANTAVSAADKATQISWEFATEIRRDNAIIAAMAAQLNLTTEQVDDLFIAAAGYV